MTAGDRVHIALRLPVELDKCDVATLAGIVREALQDSARFASFADFRGVKELVLTATSDDGEEIAPSVVGVQV